MRVHQYRDVERAVLERAGLATIAGERVSPDYNNERDYLLRIPHLLNTALLDMRTSIAPRRASAVLSTPGQPMGGGWTKYSLPEDCFRVLSGGVHYCGGGGGTEPCNDYRLLGDKAILLPDGGEGKRPGDGGLWVVDYLAGPPEIPPSPFPDFTFWEDPEIVNCAILYAAAQLVMDDSEFQYAALNNEYEGRLARLRPNVTAEAHTVQDVMGNPGVYGVYGGYAGGVW